MRGQTAAAQRVYLELEKVLKERLALEPNECSRQLRREVLATSVDGPVWSAGSRPSLPKPLTSLVGREGDIRDIFNLLHRDDIRLLTLLGPSRAGLPGVRLWGAAERLRETVTLPYLIFLRRDVEPRLPMARDALGTIDFEAVWKEGRAMDLDEAIDYALCGA